MPPLPSPRRLASLAQRITRPVATLLTVSAAAWLTACAGAPAADTARLAAPGLRLIGTAAIASGTEVLGSTFGGISGIDYDASSQRWLLISDDRSSLQPARIYTAQLRYTETALETPEITGVVTLRHANGQPYPGPRRPLAGMDVPDAEAVRWLPDGHFLWTSEGDFARGFGPQLRESRLDGAAVRGIPLPDSFQPSPARDRGPRSNATLEGLALAPDGRTAWLAMEMAWVQDGPVPTPQAPGGPLRITAVDVATGQALRQIAYVPDAVWHPRRIPWGPQLNGVSEVLADGPHHLLVLERAYGAGAGFGARLYRIDTRDGSDTLKWPQLAAGNHRPVAKTLVADLDTLGAGALDNLEGMAWGPPLAGGARVLVFVSDDNFNPAQTTQFIAVEWPAAAP